MKKVLAFIAIAMLGFTTTQAAISKFKQPVNNFNSLSLISLVMKPGQEKIGISIAELNQKDPMRFTCAVSVKFKSNAVTVTMNFEAATCNEAWAAAKKVIDRFLK